MAHCEDKKRLHWDVLERKKIRDKNASEKDRVRKRDRGRGRER